MRYGRSGGTRATAVAAVVVGWLLAGALPAQAQVLDSPEQQAMADTIGYALENNPTNEASEWVNPDTGRSGAVIPVRTFDGAQGQPCREFLTTITVGGRQEQGYGTACRQPDGDWEIVSEERSSTAPPSPGPFAAPQYTYRAYAPPPAYYDYPFGLYGPYRIYLSFSHVFRDRHLHRGRFFLDGRHFHRRYPFWIRERVFVGSRIHRHYRWRDRGWHRHGGHRWDRGHRGREDRFGRSRWRDREHRGRGGHWGGNGWRRGR